MCVDSIESIKDLIEAGMDIVSFMDFLDIDFREVLDRFDDKIEEEHGRLTKELA